jgi:hypothetical protein
MQNVSAVELHERIGVLAARINAATAELVQLSADLDTDGSWADIGARSCAHWLSINIGCDVWNGGEMVRAGHALEELPVLRAAFADGRLSFDKVKAVTKVATRQTMTRCGAWWHCTRPALSWRASVEVSSRRSMRMTLVGPATLCSTAASGLGGVTTGCSS